MIGIIKSGGPIMVPILACSILALAVIIERFWRLRRAHVISPEMLAQVNNWIRHGRVGEAVAVCRRVNTPMANIILGGLLNFHHPRTEIREAIEDAGRHEIPALVRHLDWLSICASVSPLLGLLGTVTGMIRVFRVIALEGPGNPTALASGISEALITTAAGLIVAIPALVFHHYLTGRADSLVEEMEKNSRSLVNLIDENQRKIPGRPGP